MAQSYTISLNRPWGSSQLGVSLPSGPEWAANEVRKAMNTWNAAQGRFAQDYFPNSNVYELQESNTSLIAVNFFTNPSDLSRSLSGYLCGVIFRPGEGLIRSAEIQMALRGPDGSVLSAINLFKLGLHCFGNALGLYSLSTLPSDIMLGPISSVDALNKMDASPSTLDLYGVHLLANVPSGSAAPSIATLPDTIPYIPAPYPVPENLELLVPLAVTSVLLGLYSRRRSMKKSLPGK